MKKIWEKFNITFPSSKLVLRSTWSTEFTFSNEINMILANGKKALAEQGNLLVL